MLNKELLLASNQDSGVHVVVTAEWSDGGKGQSCGWKRDFNGFYAVDISRVPTWGDSVLKALQTNFMRYYPEHSFAKTEPALNKELTVTRLDTGYTMIFGTDGENWDGEALFNQKDANMQIPLMFTPLTYRISLRKSNGYLPALLVRAW